MNQADDEVEEILDRIQELEILQQALQQMNETLELLLKPQPKKESPQ
jgi:hypothetical protein